MIQKPSLGHETGELRYADRVLHWLMYEGIKKFFLAVVVLYATKSSASCMNLDYSYHDWYFSVSTLPLAAQTGYTPVVQALLMKGADVNQADKEGETALHMASQEGYVEIVKFLLDRSGCQPCRQWTDSR